MASLAALRRVVASLADQESEDDANLPRFKPPGAMSAKEIVRAWLAQGGSTVKQCAFYLHESARTLQVLSTAQ